MLLTLILQASEHEASNQKPDIVSIMQSEYNLGTVKPRTLWRTDTVVVADCTAVKNIFFTVAY
jgi:hypothetical protein